MPRIQDYNRGFFIIEVDVQLLGQTDELFHTEYDRLVSGGIRDSLWLIVLSVFYQIMLDIFYLLVFILTLINPYRFFLAIYNFTKTGQNYYLDRCENFLLRIQNFSLYVKLAHEDITSLSNESIKQLVSNRENKYITPSYAHIEFEVNPK